MDDNVTVQFSRNMIGFGVPDILRPISHRKIPEAAVGPPYFYYENVAYTPKGVWSKISSFLFEVEPEFVDSSHFCAAARKRGYIHNLPIQNRFPLKPIPPLTIQEAFPYTKEWWPSWDDRKKLNCLGTSVSSGKLVEKLGDILQQFKDTPPKETQKYILYECRKSNLVWVGKNKLASLEPDEMELILGYPKNHTRGGGMNRGDRYKSLGNTFQVDTVAYHLSVLKSMFPEGVNVLSLFSGIGGAEVALHRLGIPLKNVVSVEILEVNRNIIRSWWEQTKQKGNLFELKDVQELSIDKLKHYIDSLGGFDLVIGGSPCNNLSGNNRVTRDGLQGEHSVLFFDYFRILKDVKLLMG
ncbi:DNA (cytosine-5)-methyltransferase drm2 [Ranunculus cassubicifolius]